MLFAAAMLLVGAALVRDRVLQFAPVLQSVDRPAVSSLMLPILAIVGGLVFTVFAVLESDEEATGGSVRVVAIDVPFRQMVKITLKWALAAIPALVILYALIVGLIIATMIGWTSWKEATPATDWLQFPPLESGYSGDMSVEH
jgi:hypothetical protein